MRALAWWRKVHERPLAQESLRERLWPEAMRAGRALGSAYALGVFVLALTLDDLHLFRFPTIYPGLLLSVAVFAFAPVPLARRLVEHTVADHAERHAEAMQASLQRRRMLLVGAAALTALWLVLFSSGRTPRW